MSEDLIERLSSDLRPARRGVVASRLAVAAAAGTAAALLGVIWLLGLRPDMAQAASSGMFWIKLAYAGAFAAVGLLGVERLARPAGRAGRRVRWLAVPILLMLLAAALAFLGAPATDLRHLVMGDSAALCPWIIATLSAPLFLALVWAMRGLAPTRLRLAGALAGLAAGGFAAAVYCLHCPESGAPFVAIWYTLGMLIPCALGALVGPRLLRW
jgi:hypothetical protein